MRVLLRIIAGLAVLLVVALLAGWVFRAPLADAALTFALNKAGFDNPSLKVEKVSLSELRITGLKAGGGALSIDEIDARYSVGELLKDRRVASLTAGPGKVSATIDANGAVRVAGARVGGGGREGERGGTISAPFDSAEVKEMALSLRAPQGQATGAFSGGFSPEKGGAFTLKAKSEEISTGAWSARNASLDASVELQEGGAVKAQGEAGGDFETPMGAANGARLVFNGEAHSWREATTKGVDAMEGRGRLDLQLTEIPVASSPQLSAAINPVTFGGASIKTLAASGGLVVALSHGGVRIAAVDGAPLKLASDRGDAIAIAALDAAPLYESSSSVQTVNLVAQLSGPLLTGTAQLSAKSEAADNWAFQASGKLDERAGKDLSLGATTFSAGGAAAKTRVDADLTIATAVRSAALGAYRIKNAPLEGALHLAGDFGAQTVAVSTPGEKCISLKSADFTAAGQDMSASLDGAKLCGGAGSLVAVNWGDEPHTDFQGVLTAKSAHYRLGETTIDGAPPEIDFNGATDAGGMTVDGKIGDGRLVLNKAIIASKSDGTFSLRADKNDLTGEASLASVRLAQNVSPELVAPVVAAGKATIAKGRIDFDFTAKTPKGEKLGAGSGHHVLETGKGAVAFTSGDLAFGPDDLRVTAIIPALEGIIAQSTGGASAEARFAWGPDSVTSAGDFALRDLSFQGPTRAVTQTAGLDGELKLASLSPLKSDGQQTLSVKLIDLDALQLENGVAHFELPGDETMRIVDASFPWFGGKIGAYDSVIAFTGEKATAELRADGVQLKQIFEFVHVDGLSGEGALSGVIPIVFENGKARIVNGVLASDAPGVLHYTGQAAESAGEANGNAKVAFSILKDLRYKSLKVTINGALDGSIEFECDFQGTGDVPYGDKTSRLPVKYGINIQANFLDLLKQANLTRDVRLQVEEAKKRQETQNKD